MAKPSAAQLRARRLFVQRFGHKKGRRNARHRNLPVLHHNRHRRRNPEEGEHQKKGHSWLPILLIGGAAFFLLRGSAVGSIFGGVGAGYTQVGTDASGHPIYQAPAGSVPPAGYVQTGTAANGQAVYSYSGSGVSSLIGIAGPVVGGVSGAITALGKLFGTSSGAVPSTPIGAGAPVNFTPGVMIPVKDASGNTIGYYKYDSATGTTTEYDTAGNITGVTSPSYGPGAGAGSVPDITIGNLTTPDLTNPPASDLSAWLTGGADTTSPFDLVPTLSLDLTAADNLIGATGTIADVGQTFESALGDLFAA